MVFIMEWVIEPLDMMQERQAGVEREWGGKSV